MSFNSADFSPLPPSQTIQFDVPTEQVEGILLSEYRYSPNLINYIKIITSEVDEIRKAKESFNKSTTVKPNLFHLANTNSFEVIESYQIPCDVTLNEHFVEKGSWLMTLQIHDPDVWEMIESEDINGISIGARAEVEDL